MHRLACLVLLVGACGDDRAPGPPPIDGPFGDVVGAVCDFLDRCPENPNFAIAYRSRDECQQILGYVLTCSVTEAADGSYGIVQNVPSIDRAAADACVAWLAAATCEDLASGGGSPCAGLIEIADDDGGGIDEACSYDTDCRSDLYCTPGGVDMTAGISYCQVCRPRKSEGEECDAGTRQCADPLYCRYEGDDAPRRCRAADADGAPCFESEQCASGFCNIDLAETNGLCDAGGALGQPCETYCRSGLYCDGGSCAEPRANGAACTEDPQCLYGRCDPSGVCGSPDGTPCSVGYECASSSCPDGTCAPPAPGASCRSDDECLDGELCHWTTERCTTPQLDGSACRRDEECASGWCTSDDVCRTRPAIGEACEGSLDCGPRAFCSADVCTARPGPDQACSGVDSCLPPFICQSGRCTLIDLSCRPAPAGAQCAFLRVCEEGTFCDYTAGITCRARGGEGAACLPVSLPSGDSCADGFRCVVDAAGSTCRRRAALGETCDGSETACIEGSFCANGTCMAAPIGQPCDYDAPCPAGLFCSDRVDRCLPPGGDGTPCNDTVECAADLYCERPSCAPRLPIGAECSSSDECARAGWCDTSSRTCVADLPMGATCRWTDDSCAEGLRCPTAGDSTCRPLQAGGQSCFLDEDCASGACHDASFCLASPMCTPR